MQNMELTKVYVMDGWLHVLQQKRLLRSPLWLYVCVCKILYVLLPCTKSETSLFRNRGFLTANGWSDEGMFENDRLLEGGPLVAFTDCRFLSLCMFLSLSSADVVSECWGTERR